MSAGATWLPGARVVVTGGAGFIGGHLVDALLAGGADKVAVVDTFFLGSERNLADARAEGGDRLAVYREDAGDPVAMAQVCREVEPTVVFNLATKALRYSFFNPPGAFRVNVEVALTLCELLRQGAFARLVHLSSSEVYGTAQSVPMSEEHPLAPETTYAAGKAAADLAVDSYVRMYDLDVMTLRPFNNFGPRQNPGAFAAVIPLTVSRILDGRPPVIEGDGQQTRDFIYVLDTVDAVIRAAGVAELRGRTLNLGSGRETTIAELVEAIATQLGWQGGIEHAPARPADVRRHQADVREAEAVLGPIARTGLAEGLAPTIAWYRSAALD